MDSSMLKGVTHVICCTGTTAFPSQRWDGDNTPERVDWEGMRNLVLALPSSLKRIVHVSSIGVTKINELPWSKINLFGVLKYKKVGVDFVHNSGLLYTIIRLLPVNTEECAHRSRFHMVPGYKLIGGACSSRSLHTGTGHRLH